MRKHAGRAGARNKLNCASMSNTEHESPSWFTKRLVVDFAYCFAHTYDSITGDSDKVKQLAIFLNASGHSFYGVPQYYSLA